MKAWAPVVGERSEGESRVAMGPGVVPLSVSGGVHGRRTGQRSVAVEPRADHRGGGGDSGRGRHGTGRRTGCCRQR